MAHFRLFEQYTEERVVESMGAFDGLDPIPSEYQKPTFAVIEKEFINKVLGLKKGEYNVLGSTFKKKRGQTSGDIDIAVNGLVFGGKNGLRFDEVVDKVYELLGKTFPYEVNLTKGLGVTNIKFPQYDESGKKTDKFVQIDFMVVDDVDLATFIYHSPDFTKEESKYKGLYRTILLYDIVRNIDLGEAEYYKGEFGGEYDGVLKSFKKYTLTAHKGLITQIKSFDGKKGPKKNAATVKGADKFITKNPEEIAKFVLGPDATPMDLTSFESMYAWMKSDKFAHKPKFKDIIDSYKQSMARVNMPLPSELD